MASSSDSSSQSQHSLFFKIPGDDDLLGTVASGHHWNRREKYVWFFTLLAGTTAVYASRTTMPLVAPAAASSLHWSKTEVGIVLSSFFWGYALTQVLGGYLSDRFGAERVILAAGLGWGLLTFWFHQIVYLFQDRDTALRAIVLSRVLLGACQGVHFPAMASISSRNLNMRERTFFFSVITSGGALGTLLTGTVGSYMNETFGWPSVFYTIGLISLLWVSCLKYIAMETSKQKHQVLGLSASTSLLGSGVAASESKVPWLVYLRHRSLWACIICHFCQNNCFFILLSWMPTYFHDNFPEAKSWVFNVVPWLLMIPGIVFATLVTNKLLARGFQVGQTRKIAESVCMGTQAICLVFVGQVESSFAATVALFATCLFASGFHNTAVIVNPQDIAPKHSGSIFGIVNTAGAIPGAAESFSTALALSSLAVFACGFHKFGTAVNAMDIAPRHSGSVYGIVNTASSISGFIGVYLAGYILELTGSWASVFNVTALINVVGIVIFCLFGSGTPIL